MFKKTWRRSKILQKSFPLHGHPQIPRNRADARDWGAQQGLWGLLREGGANNPWYLTCAMGLSHLLPGKPSEDTKILLQGTGDFKGFCWRKAAVRKIHGTSLVHAMDLYFHFLSKEAPESYQNLSWVQTNSQVSCWRERMMRHICGKSDVLDSCCEYFFQLLINGHLQPWCKEPRHQGPCGPMLHPVQGYPGPYGPMRQHWLHWPCTSPARKGEIFDFATEKKTNTNENSEHKALFRNYSVHVFEK